MRSYYIIVKSELICAIGSVKADMWDRISVPCAVRMGKPQRMRRSKTCLKRSKTLRKGEIIIANHLYEVVEGFLAK